MVVRRVSILPAKCELLSLRKSNLLSSIDGPTCSVTNEGDKILCKNNYYRIMVLRTMNNFASSLQIVKTRLSDAWDVLVPVIATMVMEFHDSANDATGDDVWLNLATGLPSAVAPFLIPSSLGLAKDILGLAAFLVR
jgi:hypothetical protein